jgi:ferredoxin-NADP reductase
VIECCGLSGLGPSGFADPYAQVVILGPTGLMSEVRKGLIHRKDNDPQMNETFFFPLSETQLKDAIVRVSLWHHTSLSEDLFLGQVM